VIIVDEPRHSVLSLAAAYGSFILVQWLIEEGAIIRNNIWEVLNIRVANAARLSSLLKVLTLIPILPDLDNLLPGFVAKLSPQHAALCTRDRLPAYLEQQRTSLHTHCPLPTVIQAMVTAYALPTSEDLWTDWVEWM
jgi:hypothetical protein